VKRDALGGPGADPRQAIQRGYQRGDGFGKSHRLNSLSRIRAG